MVRILAICALLFAAPAALAGVRQLTLDQLCDGATRIVVGGVIKTQPEWQGSLIVTRVTVQPTENLKGTGSAPFIFTVPGGTIGNVTMKASEAPDFQEGEHVVLFLKPGASRCDVYGWFQGKYTVVNGNVRELKATTFAAFRSQILSHVGGADGK